MGNTPAPPQQMPASTDSPAQEQTTYGATALSEEAPQTDSLIPATHHKHRTGIHLDSGHVHVNFEGIHGDGTEENETEVTTLELFSDLVIVIAIHTVASDLEEVDYNDFGWYIIRVFLLWFVWHMSMIFMNVAAVFDIADCPSHYFIVFTWMALVLRMTQDFALEKDQNAIGIYLIIRVLETLVYFGSVYSEKPDHVPDERVSNMRSFVPKHIRGLIVCEFIPMGIALANGNREDGPWYPAVIASVLLIVSNLVFAGVMSDRAAGGNMMGNSFDLDHLEERYELVTLIFIGEICFAAGKPSDDEYQYIMTFSALVVAFGAFLLVFSTHSIEQDKFWYRGSKFSVFGMLLYAGMFCAIPGIGSGYSLIMEANDGADEAEAGAGAGIDEERNLLCDGDSADLLCYSASAFLIFSALMNLINIEQPREISEAKLTIWQRFSIRFICGIIVLIIGLAPQYDSEYSSTACIANWPSNIFIVPVFFLIPSFVEVWAVNSLEWSNAFKPTAGFWNNIKACCRR